MYQKADLICLWGLIGAVWLLAMHVHRITVFWILNLALRWRHNELDGVSDNQPHGCLLNRLFRRRSEKTSKLRVTGLCVGNSPGPVNSPHKGPVTRNMFPFDDVIMDLRADRPGGCRFPDTNGQRRIRNPHVYSFFMYGVTWSIPINIEFYLSYYSWWKTIFGSDRKDRLPDFLLYLSSSSHMSSTFCIELQLFASPDPEETCIMSTALLNNSMQ